MRAHKYKKRGTTPELREILDRFYSTPAGKAIAKNSAHIESDKAAAKAILNRLLQHSSQRPRVEILSIVEIITDIEI